MTPKAKLLYLISAIEASPAPDGATGHFKPNFATLPKEMFAPGEAYSMAHTLSRMYKGFTISENPPSYLVRSFDVFCIGDSIERVRDKISQDFGDDGKPAQHAQPESAYEAIVRRQKERDEEANRAYQNRMDDDRKSRESREALRIQRLAASGKSPLVYSLDAIIEACQLNEGGQSFQIDFYTLGFEDNFLSGVVQKAHKLFLKLKDIGGFKTVERVGNTWFHVTGWDVKKIMAYRDSITAGQVGTTLDSQTKLTPAVARQQKNSKAASAIDATLREKLSVATAWEQIRMEFGQDETRVEIFVQNQVVNTYHFSDLGFQKESATIECVNTESWGMLRKMALMGGEFPYKDADFKTKGDLSKRLKALFQHLNGEPIKCDSEKKVYRCNFQLKDKVGNRNNFIDQGRPGKRPYRPLLKSV